jgi:signal transduction histidine kinase
LGDQTTLTQVMVTLLSNLIQRSKSGDTIEISARDQKDVVEFQLAAPAAALLNAPGGTPDQLDRFDRFDQLFDWPSGASGKGAEELALALCKAAIEAHGGRIGATSKKSDGVAFWFRLPAVVIAAGDAAAASDEPSA